MKHLLGETDQQWIGKGLESLTHVVLLLLVERERSGSDVDHHEKAADNGFQPHARQPKRPTPTVRKKNDPTHKRSGRNQTAGNPSPHAEGEASRMS